MCEFRYGEAQPWEISLWEKDKSPFISTSLVTKGWSRRGCKYENWKLDFEHNAFYALHDILESLSFVCFLKLHFGHISCRDVKNKFYVLPWKKQNMADNRIPQYITSKGNIIWSPRTSGKSFECCFRKLKVICFCPVPGGSRRAFCNLQNTTKIRYSQANSAAGLTRCCWHLTSSRKRDCRTPQGIFSPSC